MSAGQAAWFRARGVEPGIVDALRAVDAQPAHGKRIAASRRAAAGVCAFVFTNTGTQDAHASASYFYPADQLIRAALSFVLLQRR